MSIDDPEQLHEQISEMRSKLEAYRRLVQEHARTYVSPDNSIALERARHELIALHGEIVDELVELNVPLHWQQLGRTWPVFECTFMPIDNELGSRGVIEAIGWTRLGRS